jgi:hypothetical protein
MRKQGYGFMKITLPCSDKGTNEMKAETKMLETCPYVCPIKLYLHKQAQGQIGCMGHDIKTSPLNSYMELTLSLFGLCMSWVSSPS